MTLALRWLGVLSLVGGILLTADAVIRGDASVALLLIVPVVSGRSPEFLLGVLLIVVGLILVAFTPVFADDREPRASQVPAPTDGAGTSGGVLLIGPFPVFFGSWKGPSRRARWAWWILGLVLLVMLIAGYLLAFGLL